MKRQKKNKHKEERVSKHIGKKKKRITACVDKRRQMDTCGLCGSEDVVWFGVVFCYGRFSCGAEIDFISAEVDWFGRYNVKLEHKSNCTEHAIRMGDRWGNSSHSYINGSCQACGAMKGVPCPNCKRSHWSHWDIGRKVNLHYCERCGFRV